MERAFQYDDPWHRFRSAVRGPVLLCEDFFSSVSFSVNVVRTGLCSLACARLHILQRESARDGLQTEFPRDVM